MGLIKGVLVLGKSVVVKTGPQVSKIDYGTIRFKIKSEAGNVEKWVDASNVNTDTIQEAVASVLTVFKGIISGGS